MKIKLMYTGLLHLHSLLRYLILIFLIISVITSFTGWRGKKAYKNSDNKVSLFLLIFVHTQFLVGLVLYFVSPIVQAAFADFGGAMKIPGIRFFAVEHILAMIVAVILITVGRSKTKKATTDTAKHRLSFTYNFIALILIFAAIPWPFSQISRGMWPGM